MRTVKLWALGLLFMTVAMSGVMAPTPARAEDDDADLPKIPGLQVGSNPSSSSWCPGRPSTVALHTRRPAASNSTNVAGRRSGSM